MGGNRYATRPINAMLTYAYAVPESQVGIATVTNGLDPTIGYLHACRPRRAALVYDLMELLHPIVDRKLVEMIRYRSFAAVDFFLQPSGVVRLNPKLAKYLASEIQVDREESEKVAGSVVELLNHTAASL